MGFKEVLRARKRFGEFGKELHNFDDLAHPVKQAHGHEIEEVRRFLATTYHDRHIVSDGMVDPETGTLLPGIEVGLDRSEFFYAPGTDGRTIDASARLIHAATDDGAHSFQMHVNELPDRWQQVLSGLPLDKTAEFASLVKAPGVSTTAVMNLVREMLHYSADHGIEYWLWGMEEPIANSYHKLFGDIITRMGPPVHFGEFHFEHVPQLLNVQYGIERFRHPKLVERFMGKAALFAFMSRSGDSSAQA